MKQLKNLIKCHFSYAFNKRIILMLFMIIILNNVYNYYLLVNYSKNLDFYTLYKYYFDSSFSFVNFVDSIIVVSIFSYSFLKKQDQYCVLLVTSEISKNKVFFSKYLTIIIMVFYFCFVQMISFYAPTFLFETIKYIDKTIIYSFIDLFLVLIFYGNMALILILVTDNFYSIFIPVAYFLISYNLILSKDKIDGILKYIICLSPQNWRIYQEYGFVFLVNIIIFLIIYKIYLKKEY